MELNRMWHVFTSLVTAVVVAIALTYVVVQMNAQDEGDPVVITTEFKLLTPKVPVGTTFTFQVWRDSAESCPGVGVVSMSPEPNTSGVVISQRYPLGSPGFKSPPPLTITRQLPLLVGPGRWRVRTGVDSICPTRKQYDQTGDFILEVVPIVKGEPDEEDDDAK